MVDYDVCVVFVWFVLSNIIHFGTPMYKLKSRNRQLLQVSLALNYMAMSVVSILITIGAGYTILLLGIVFTCRYLYVRFH